MSEYWLLTGVVLANIIAVTVGAIAILAQYSIQFAVIAAASLVLSGLIFLAK